MADLPDGFDLAALLAPLAGDAPAGVDLRQDFSPQSLYFRLRDARSEARQAERMIDQAADNPPLPEASWGVKRDTAWRGIRELAGRALLERTKDLEIAAWYTEALLRSDGLGGFTAGSLLLAGLAEAFWDALYPLPDEDGIATRVAPISGLNDSDGSLIQPLRKLPMLPRRDGSMLTFYDHEQSAEVAAISDPARREQRLAGGEVAPLEEVESWARAAAQSHLAPLRAAAEAAYAAWEAMAEIMAARAGADGPSTSRVRDVLEQIRRVAAKYAPPEAAPEAGAEPGGEALAAGAQPGSGYAAIGAGSREDMLRELGRIADFFRRTEPHSPLAYTLEEAVRRGRMNWPELLEEIVPDPTARSAIQTALGIKPAEPA